MAAVAESERWAEAGIGRRPPGGGQRRDEKRGGEIDRAAARVGKPGADAGCRWKRLAGGQAFPEDSVKRTVGVEGSAEGIRFIEIIANDGGAPPRRAAYPLVRSIQQLAKQSLRFLYGFFSCLRGGIPGDEGAANRHTSMARGTAWTGCVI